MVPTPQELREIAEKATSEQWAKNMNEEYGPFPNDGAIRAYEPHDMLDDTVDGKPIGNRAPLATDLVQWTLWLRESTDFFSGPSLDQHHPRAADPEFYEVLAGNALEYTGE